MQGVPESIAIDGRYVAIARYSYSYVLCMVVGSIIVFTVGFCFAHYNLYCDYHLII